MVVLLLILQTTFLSNISSIKKKKNWGFSLYLKGSLLRGPKFNFVGLKKI